MDEIDLRDSRAEQVQPQGFVPSNLAESMLRDPATRAATLEFIATTAGEIVLATDLMDGETSRRRRENLAAHIAEEARRIQRLAKAMLKAAPGAALALALVAAVVAGPSAGAAQAMEAPQPDPVAQTVRVVLGAAPVTVMVRATVYTPVAPGWWCASVWSAARGRVGATCSISPSFPIPVTIDPRTFPVGRSFAQVVDDATDTAVGNVIIDARRPSRFGVGYFEDLGRGDLGVRVPVTLYSPTLGRWVPQVQSPVQVQELVGRTWRVRATLTTNPPGLAVGIVYLGGGRHVIRVVRPAGRTVWSTTGRVHVFDLLTEPIDVD